MPPNTPNEIEAILERFEVNYLRGLVTSRKTDIKDGLRVILTQLNANRTAEMEKGIGFLRQWLNEDRIIDPKRMVSNDEIKTMMAITSN